MRISLAVILLLTPPLAAAPREQTGKHGTAVVTLSVDRTEVPLSGSIDVTLTVEGAAPLEVELPDRLAAPDGLWLEQPLSDAKTEPLPGQRSRWRRTFRLEPLGNKEIPLQIAALRFRAGKSEQWYEQTWKSIPVQVTTSVEDPSLKALRDITPIEQVPAPEEWRPWGLVLGGVGVAVAVIALAVWKRRRRPVPPPELTPAEWALRELERLDALDLATERAVECFHIVISDVLRQFLERRFNQHVTGRTTPEFLDEMRRSARLAPEQQELLREFCRQCDLAKFARAEFSVPECKALVRTARELVRHLMDEATRTAVAS